MEQELREFKDNLERPRNPYDPDLKALRGAVSFLLEKVKVLEERLNGNIAYDSGVNLADENPKSSDEEEKAEAPKRRGRPKKEVVS